MVVTRSQGTGPLDYPGRNPRSTTRDQSAHDATQLLSDISEGALTIDIDGESHVRFNSLEEAQQAAKLRQGSEAVVQVGEHFILKAASAEDIRNFTSATMDPNTVAFSVSNASSPQGEIDVSASSVLRDNMQDNLSELSEILETNEHLRSLAHRLVPDTNGLGGLTRTTADIGVDANFDNPQVTIQEQSPEFMARLDELAPIFGFNDGANMVKQFRKLNTADFAQLQQIINQAYEDFPDLSSVSERNAQIDRQFSTYLQGEVSGMFAEDAQPTFEVSYSNRVEGRTQWDSASTLALYNSLLTRQQDDAPGFRTITSKPVTFVRAAHPVTDFGRHLMGQLTRNMQVASKENTIDIVTLFDAALTGSPDDVVRGNLEREIDLIMSPPYRVGHPPHPESEIERFGLDDEHIETTLMNPESKFYQQYGMKSMQEAMGFVIRTRGLNKPNRYFNPPLQPIPKENWSEEMTPEAEALLQRVMTEMAEGPREDLLRMFTIQAQKMDASAGLQEMLNDARADGAEISTDGLWGPNTRRALRQFQLQQHISSIIENIDDDRTIPSANKAELRSRLNQLYGQLQGTMDNASLGRVLTQTENYLHHILERDMDSETEATLLSIQGELGDVREPNFQYGDVRGLIDDLIYNWFDIMHSGDNTDTAEQLMTHELTHVSVHRMLKSDPDFMRNWTQMGWNKERLGSLEMSMAGTLSNDATGEYSSDYAATNPDDDVAENVRTFLYQPERLLSYGENHHHNLMKFLFINNKTHTYNPEQVIELFEQAGVSREDVQEALREILGHGSSMALAEAIIDLQERMEHPRMDAPPEMSNPGEFAGTADIQPIEILDLSAPPRTLKEPVSLAEGLGQNAGINSGDLMAPKSLSEGLGKTIYGADLKLKTFEDSHVRFTSEQSASLGSQYRTLFEHYDIDPNELVSAGPSDPGFALQHMVEQFQIVYSSEVEQQQAEQSLEEAETRAEDAFQQLEDFSARGIEAFPPEVQQAIPSDVRERLSDPQNRAVYRALGNVLTNAEHLKQFTYTPNPDLTPEERHQERAQLRDDRHAYIQESIGSETYAQLPESFRLLLQDESYLSSVTGQYGDVTLNMNTVIDETFAQMQYLDDEVEDTFLEALKPLSKLIKTMQTQNKEAAQETTTQASPTAQISSTSTSTIQPLSFDISQNKDLNAAEEGQEGSGVIDTITSSSYYEDFTKIIENIEKNIGMLNEKRGSNFTMPSTEDLYQMFSDLIGAEGEQVSTEGSYFGIYKEARNEMVEQIQIMISQQPAPPEEPDSSQEEQTRGRTI